jgi:dihydroorotase
MAIKIIKEAKALIEGEFKWVDILIKNDRIERIDSQIDTGVAVEEISSKENGICLPGLIDDQVHFREPGLTHKANIYTESRAAVAGGITSFMEMPNTKPPAVTIEELEKKYAIAAKDSLANYTFYMGTTNENVDEIRKVDFSKVCGTKIFMGSSTGNMLVDNRYTLETIFSSVDSLIATHCEDTPMILANEKAYKVKYGENVPMIYHPDIRSREACLASSSMAVELAKKHGARLHVLHISTAEETKLFEAIPLDQKQITAEACIHHLWFSREDYEKKGTYIKWNPAVKDATDRDAIRQAVVDGRIDILATDHAPHTIQEKENTYFSAPSGGPLVQHALPALADLVEQDIFTWPLVVEKYCHNPARLFNIVDRGFLREGYFADIVLYDLGSSTNGGENILSKCGWSPFSEHEFKGAVDKTFINGNVAYNAGKIQEVGNGQRLTFTPRSRS